MPNFDMGRMYTRRVTITATGGGGGDLPIYQPPRDCVGILVELIGGGGGGGGAAGVANCSVGGGGAAGARVLKYFAGPFAQYGTAASGVPIYAVGSGANGGSGGADGSNGGDTTFQFNGTTVTAKGGLGGKFIAAGTTNVFALGGAGVIGTNGDVNGIGAPGGYGERISGTVAVSGAGGSTEYGQGGNSVNTDSNGNAGSGYGAGGGGAVGFATTSNGGDGSGGLIIIYEFTA